MWIPGFHVFLHDFSDPIVIIATPFSMHMADDTAGDCNSQPLELSVYSTKRLQQLQD